MLWRRTIATVLTTLMFTVVLSTVSFADQIACACSGEGVRPTQLMQAMPYITARTGGNYQKATQQAVRSTPQPRYVKTEAPSPMPPPNRGKRFLDAFAEFLGQFTQ